MSPTDKTALIVLGVNVGMPIVGIAMGMKFERNKWRDEMISRKLARYNWLDGKWEWGAPPRADWRKEQGAIMETQNNNG